MGLFFIVKDDTFVPCAPPAQLDVTQTRGDLVYQGCNDVDLQYSLQSTASGVMLRVRGEDLADQSIQLPADYASQDYFILIEPEGAQKVQLRTLTQLTSEVSSLSGVLSNLKSYHERFWNILSTEKYATETGLYTLVSKLRANPNPDELSAINQEKERLLNRLSDLERSLSSLSLQLGKTPLSSNRGEILYLFEKYAPTPIAPEPAKKVAPPDPTPPSDKPTPNDAIRKHTESLSIQRQIYEIIIAFNQLKAPSETGRGLELRTKAQELLVALDRTEKELKVLHEQLKTPLPTFVYVEIEAQLELAATRAAARMTTTPGPEITKTPIIQEPNVAQPRRIEPNPEAKLTRKPPETQLPPAMQDAAKQREQAAAAERKRLEAEARKRQGETAALERQKAALAKARLAAEELANKVSEDAQELGERAPNILPEKNRQTLDSFATEIRTSIANARKELPKITKLGLSDPEIKNAHDRVDGSIEQLEAILGDITTAITQLPKSDGVAAKTTTFTERTLTTKDVSHEAKPITYVEFPSNMADWDKPAERQTMANFLAHERRQYPDRKIGIVFYGNKDKFEKMITKAINLANEILKTQKGKVFTGNEFDIIPYAETGDPGRPFIKFYFLAPGNPSLNTRIGEADEDEAFKRPFYGVIDDLVAGTTHRRIAALDLDSPDSPIDLAEQAFTNVGFTKVTKGSNYVAVAFEYFKGDQKALGLAGEQILKALTLLKKPKIKTEGIVVFYNGDDSIQTKLFKPLTDASFPANGIFRPIGSLHDNRNIEDRLREGEDGSKERILVLFSFPGDGGSSILQSIYLLEQAKANPRQRIDKTPITKDWFERSKKLIEQFYPKK